MAETLITSSVIILMLCAIRILFKGRIRPTVQYGRWGIAAARLALPCFYPVIRWFGSLQSPSGGPGSRCHSAFRRGSG